MPLRRDDLDRRIVHLALPALGTLAVEPVYVLVDTAIVGRLGTGPLAGLAIAATVLLTVVSLLSFLQYGVTPAVAFAHGAGDPLDARRTATTALTLAAAIGVPLAIVLAVLADPLVRVFGGEGDVTRLGAQYLRISAVGVPFILVALAGHGVLRGVNDLVRPLRIVLVANVVNLALELIAVYGLDLGIAGSAWSTVLVQVAAAGWFLVLLRPHIVRFRPPWSRLRAALVTGAHLAVRSLAMFAVWNTATAIAAHIGTTTLAAHQVLTQLFLFLALALDALAIPAQSLVAGALGTGRLDEAMRIGRSCTRLSVWCGLGLGGLLAATSPLLPSLFTDDAAVRHRLVLGLLLLAVMQLPGAGAFALDGVLIGGRDQTFLARQAVRNLAAFLPLAVATLIWPRLGLAGLWGAQLVWMTVRAAVNERRFRSQRWTGAAEAAAAMTPGDPDRLIVGNG